MPSSSRFSLSALLTATRTGAGARRSSSAASLSAGVRPVTASTTKTMTSASAMARRACSWTRASIGSFGSSSRPPVSTSTNRRPFHSVSPYSRSRVVRARSSTIAVREPRTRLKSVLLPTFGRPTMATTGSAPPSRVVAGAVVLAATVQAAPDVGRAVLGREVVRPAGVAATARAAPASSEARACTSGVPAISRMCWATSRRSSIGVDVPPVTPDDVRASRRPRGRSGHGPLRPGSRASRRSRTAGSAPWCSRWSDRRRPP